MDDARQQIELNVLHHVTTSAQAVEKCKVLGITDAHFTFIEEDSTACLTASMFKLVLLYYTESGGSLLTERVLDLKLRAAGTGNKMVAKYLLLWQEIQDQDVSPHDLHAELIRLKELRALSRYRSVFSECTKLGLHDGVVQLEERLREIKEEISPIQRQVERLDMSRDADWVEAEFMKRIEHPELFKGIECGLPAIDEKTFGFLPGQITCLLAPSSGGKSIHLLNFANYAWEHEGKNIFYVSLEMSLWLVTLRHLALRFGVKYDYLKNVLQEQSPAIVKGVIEKMRGIQEQAGPYFEYDVAMHDPTPEYIRSRVMELAATKGKPDLVVIDYMGKMRTRDVKGRDAKNWEGAGDASNKLLIDCQELGFHVLTAQQVKSGEVKESRRSRQAGKAHGFYQEAASGDQRLVHDCTYMFGIESNKELGLSCYWPSKMRDGEFAPFLVRVNKDTNRISTLKPEEAAEHLHLFGLNADGSEQKPEIDVRVTPHQDGTQTVQVRGHETNYTEDDLEIALPAWGV